MALIRGGRHQEETSCIKLSQASHQRQLAGGLTIELYFALLCFALLCSSLAYPFSGTDTVRTLQAYQHSTPHRHRHRHRHRITVAAARNAQTHSHWHVSIHTGAIHMCSTDMAAERALPSCCVALSSLTPVCPGLTLPAMDLAADD